MDRDAIWLDRESDTLIFVATGPGPEPEIYDYPGVYGQRFDGIGPGGSDDGAAPAIHAGADAGMDYANSFECIPDG